MIEPALRDGDTHEALRAFRRRSLAMTGIGIASEVLGSTLLVIAGFPENGPVYWLVILLIGGGVVPLLGGVVALVNSLRMAAALAHHAWQVLPMRYGEVGVGPLPNGQPTLLIGDEGKDVLSLVSFNWRWPTFATLDTIWFAGDLRRGGVVSPPGGTYLAWARHPRTGWWRRALRRRVLAIYADPV